MEKMFCKWCGNEIPYKINPSSKKPYVFCSRSCNGKNKSWKGGVINCHGYMMIHSPSHPMANAKNYVYIHRMLMAEKIGRILTKKDIVHHINGNKLDNRIENLALLTESQHNGLHGVEHAKKYLHKQYSHICKSCGIEYLAGPNSLRCFPCGNKYEKEYHSNYRADYYRKNKK
jgi:hypothetical protein